MDDTEYSTGLVTVRLPNGALMKVEVADGSADDGVSSVGLRDLDLEPALERVAEVGSLVMDKIKTIKPAKATVELRLAFSVEAGKLTALWVGGKGKAALKVTLEWLGQFDDPGAPNE